MDIDVPLKELGEVDVKPLADAILAQDDAAWFEDEYRQQSYDVHLETQSIVLVFTDGKNWPDADVRKEPGWDRLADAAVPLMHSIIDAHYPKGGTIIRAMAAKLLVGGKIRPHRDGHASFHCGHRIHIPITTNPRVRFMLDGRPYKFEVGQAYEINNQLTHSVMNKGKEDRITFIFDYVPPGPLAVRSDIEQ
ncbi:MAG: aspartyl/asparaginyl beta-hydroxylase domain-containing protein [Pseudomonadota bacterium]